MNLLGTFKNTKFSVLFKQDRLRLDVREQLGVIELLEVEVGL